jgi:hypothetical protein
MFSGPSRFLERLRAARAIGSTCLALVAGISPGTIEGQPSGGGPDKGVSSDGPGISERIKLVRAAFQNQPATEPAYDPRGLLAQWFNFGNFRPSINPYGAQPYYPQQVPGLPFPQQGQPVMRGQPPPNPYPQGGYIPAPPMWRNF